MLAGIPYLFLEYNDIFIRIILSNSNGSSTCTPPSVTSNANWFGLEECTAITRGYPHTWIGKV